MKYGQFSNSELFTITESKGMFSRMFSWMKNKTMDLLSKGFSGGGGGGKNNDDK
jgi:hypothetical protein